MKEFIKLERAVCTITDRGNNEYTLGVDFMEIPFNGFLNADYFKDFYEGLGYIVVLCEDKIDYCVCEKPRRIMAKPYWCRRCNKPIDASK